MPINTDASFVDHMPTSMPSMLNDRVAASAEHEAFRYPKGDEWISVTWAETKARVDRLAAGLLSLGIASEERVGIVANTRLEWILSDLAVMAAAGATTTVYPSTNAEDTIYILSDSQSRVVFAENDAQLDKLLSNKAELPHVLKVVTYDGTSDGDWVISLDDLEQLGAAYLATHPTCVDDATASVKPEALATLIYTSGTTGRPKGVRLSHRSWVYEGQVIRHQGILDERDLQFLWLPMAHSFGKVLLSAQLACGFATAIDGTVEKIIDNVAVVRPTFMGAAPRIFEKAYARIVTMQQAEGGLKEKLFNKAFAVGLQVDDLKAQGNAIPPMLGLQHKLFDKLVFAKVRARFGGRIRFFISGAAALNRDIAEWFHAAGIVILEGYGLTETAAGAFVNHPDNYKFGTVGPVFPGSEAKIAEDGEVMIKGPSIMQGYHNLPEETAAALTPDGWLHTGDEGRIDENGFLRITGRKKELFKTSGGKYIAPPAIEAKFKALCPYASQFIVFGAERNFVVALITLDADAIVGWAAENGLAGKSYTDIVQSEQAREMTQGYVDQLNAELNKWETIKKWSLLDHDLSVETGELTPSMKVKRGVVETNHKALIDGFYS